MNPEIEISTEIKEYDVRDHFYAFTTTNGESHTVHVKGALSVNEGFCFDPLGLLNPIDINAVTNQNVFVRYAKDRFKNALNRGQYIITTKDEKVNTNHIISHKLSIDKPLYKRLLKTTVTSTYTNIFSIKTTSKTVKYEVLDEFPH